MKNVENKIISNVTPLIPFSFLSKRLNKDWRSGKNNKIGYIGGLRVLANFLITAVITYGGGGYIICSIAMKDINYKHWSQIQKEERIQQEQSHRIYLMKRFKEADSDSTGTLNFEEFYNYEGGLYRK